ncbi:MAG: hypothetical protein R2727_03395 [Bacteroidales bacterium]
MEIEGYIITNPEYIKFCDPGNRVDLFYSRLSKSPESWGTFVDDSISPGQSESKGVANGMYLTFSTVEGEEVLIKTSLSYTSTGNAGLTLKAKQTIPGV